MATTSTRKRPRGSEDNSTPLLKMPSAVATCALDHAASSLNVQAPAATMKDLRRTESLETLPDISPTTLSQDMRELSAWYRAQDTPNARGDTPGSSTTSDPSLSDGREVLLAPSQPRGLVRHTSVLSQASTLTSIESDAETESTLTSLESDCDTESTLTALESDLDDHPQSHIRATSGRRAAPAAGGICQTTATSSSRPTRKRKRSGCQPVRHSKRLMAKRRKLAPS